MRIDMPLGVGVHFCVCDVAYLLYAAFVVDHGVFHALRVAACRGCRHSGKDACDGLRIDVFIKKSAAGTAVRDEAFHIVAHFIGRRRQRILRLFAEDRDRPLRTNCETMLTSPTAAPAEALKFIHLRVSVRTESDHHTGAGVDTFAAFDTL